MKRRDLFKGLAALLGGAAVTKVLPKDKPVDDVLKTERAVAPEQHGYSAIMGRGCCPTWYHVDCRCDVCKAGREPNE